MKRLLNTQDGFEKAIELSLKNIDFRLTEPMENVKARLRFCHDRRLILLQTGKEMHKVRNAVVEAIVREFGISIAQAYKDYSLAEQVLDNAPSIHKKEISYNLQLAALQEDMMLAREEGDLRALAQMHKVFADLNKSFPDGNVTDWANIKFPVIEAVFNPALINSKVVENPKELELLNEKMKKKYAEKSAAQFLNSISTDIEINEK